MNSKLFLIKSLSLHRSKESPRTVEASVVTLPPPLSPWETSSNVVVDQFVQIDTYFTRQVLHPYDGFQIHLIVTGEVFHPYDRRGMPMEAADGGRDKWIVDDELVGKPTGNNEAVVWAVCHMFHTLEWNSAKM